MSKKSRAVRRSNFQSMRAGLRVRIAALRITHPKVSAGSIKIVLEDFDAIRTEYDLSEFRRALELLEVGDPDDDHANYIARNFNPFQGFVEDSYKLTGRKATGYVVDEFDEIEHRIAHQGDCYGRPERVQTPNRVPQALRAEQARLRHVRRGYR
jgi:hypothetical protein